MSHAWHAGVVAKAAKTPSLAELLGEPVKAQAADEMSANLSAWVSATKHLGD